MNANNPFAEYLIKNRKKQGYNQKDLVDKLHGSSEKVDISQSLLSAFEKGRKFPSEKLWRHLVLAFEDIFGNENGELDRLKSIDTFALREEILLISSTKLQTQTEKTTSSPKKQNQDFLNDISTFLEESEYLYSLWFIGNQKLPVVHSIEFEESWIKNLGKGVKYNIILLVEYINNESIVDTRQLIDKIKKIASLIEVGGEKITIYFLFNSENKGSDKNIAKEIEATCKDLASFSGIKVEKLEKKFINGSYTELMKIWQQFATITMYIPTVISTKTPPRANVRMNNMKNNINSIEFKEYYLWFDDVVSNRFYNSIILFKDEIENSKN